MTEETNISLEAATIKCAQLFTLRLSNSSSIRAEEPGRPDESTPLFSHHDAQLELFNQQDRFKIWAGSLGVLAGGRVPADWRLKDDPDIKDVIMSLLRQLSASLDNLYQDAAPSDSESFSDGSGSESSFVPVSPLELSDDETSCSEEPEDTTPKPVNGKFAEISEIITDLYRFTGFVEKSSSTDDDRRASRWVELAGDQINNELKELKEYAGWHLQERYPKLSKKFPTLRDRILNAIVQRRARLLYRVNHQNPVELQSTPRVPQVQEYPRRETAAAMPGSEGTDTRNQSALSFINTAWTKSNFVHRPGLEDRAASVVLSGTSLPAKSNSEHQDVPPAPEPPAIGIPEAMCPYCSRPLGIDIVGNGNTLQWKQHILQDIAPYVCLFEKCTTPGQQFKSKDAWIYHMSWEHARIWTCPHVEHGGRSFENPEELGDHLSQEHCVGSENLASLLEKSAKPAPDVLATFAVRFGIQDSPEKRNACPFCQEESASCDVLKEGGLADFDPVSSREIVSHIAGHLEGLALLSLPPWDENSDKVLHLRDRSRSNISMSNSSLFASPTFEDGKETTSIDSSRVKSDKTYSQDRDQSRSMGQFVYNSYNPYYSSPFRDSHRESSNPLSAMSGHFIPTLGLTRSPSTSGHPEDSTYTFLNIESAMLSLNYGLDVGDEGESSEGLRPEGQVPALPPGTDTHHDPERKWRCRQAECAERRGFKRRADLMRHISTVHPEEIRKNSKRTGLRERII